MRRRPLGQNRRVGARAHAPVFCDLPRIVLLRILSVVALTAATFKLKLSRTSLAPSLLRLFIIIRIAARYNTRMHGANGGNLQTARCSLTSRFLIQHSESILSQPEYWLFLKFYERSEYLIPLPRRRHWQWRRQTGPRSLRRSANPSGPSLGGALPLLSKKGRGRNSSNYSVKI